MKWIAPTLTLAAGLVLSVKISPAKPEYPRRTSRADNKKASAKPAK
jgi:hypothetical protein